MWHIVMDDSRGRCRGRLGGSWAEEGQEKTGPSITDRIVYFGREGERREMRAAAAECSYERERGVDQAGAIFTGKIGYGVAVLVDGWTRRQSDDDV